MQKKNGMDDISHSIDDINLVKVLNLARAVTN